MGNNIREGRRDRMAKMAVKLFVLSYCVAVFGTISLIKGNDNSNM